jgi:hypothetical protein
MAEFEAKSKLDPKYGINREQVERGRSAQLRLAQVLAPQRVPRA